MEPSVVLLLLTTLVGIVFGQCVPATERVDCHPDPNPTQGRCLARGCVWCPAENGIPSCITLPDYGYQMDSVSSDGTGYRVLLRRASTDSSYYGGDFNLLTATFTFESDYRLRIRVTPEGVHRYEVPLTIHPPAQAPTINATYSVEFLDSPAFAFRVKRRSTGTILFDTSLGGFTFADQFLQLAFKLPSRQVYGIGENEQHSFRQEFDESFKRFPLWTRDAPPQTVIGGTVNMYGVYPYYTVVEEDGNTHSVLILNSNAQEFVLHPAPGYVYRTIGGILDIFIFLGPSPEETARQFTEAIGRTPIPPYWSLGFHLCRYGYDELENMKAAVERQAFYGIPQDVQYGDTEVMNRFLIFTYDPIHFEGLPEYVRALKVKGIKYVPIVDPIVDSTEPNYEVLELGDELDVWIKRPDGTPFMGKVWPPNPVYFPDFSRNATREWWSTCLRAYHDLLEYDGIWIDMNEPANFVNGDLEQGCARDNRYNYPPFLPNILGGELSEFTICPDTQQDFGLHYDTHSLYAWSQARATLTGAQLALGRRSFVLTRSSFLGVGEWSAHWLGDNISLWSYMHYSIIGILQFNQFGVPFVGADICGFYGSATEELCTRWMQLGSFYPFCRNHNVRDTPDQDPAVWSPESAASSRDALLLRYTLLPYLYTLFYYHQTRGNTVARALWHTFPNDETALGVDRQFMWGDGLLISPVLDPGQITVRAYFPDARWYSYHDGGEVASMGQYVTLGAPYNFINLHVRGGVVIPTQEPAINTELARLNPYGLIVTLDREGSASGGFYLDDGDSIDPQISGDYFEANYQVSNQQLTSSIAHAGYNVAGKVLGTIRLFGYGRPLTELSVNGQPHSNHQYLPSGEVLISGLGVRLNQSFTMSWI